MLIGKTELRQEKAVAPGVKRAPDPTVDVSENPSVDRKDVIETGSGNVNHSLAVAPRYETHNSGTLVRFLGLLTLLIVAVGSLVFAITQNSLRGITWMAVTTAITGICFYFALEEFSDAKRARNL